MITRRVLLASAAAVAASTMAASAPRATATFEITRSAEEWRRLLTADEYAVLREEATEKKYSSPLLNEKRPGLYHCRGCDLAVYSSEHKHDSFSTSTEVHCRRCGGHFGHIFDDRPPPTGERHCLNGLALRFQPAAG